MKIEVEITPDQLDLLEKIKTLTKVLQEHIGNLPASFPNGYEMDRIKELCESLEFRWKKWILDSIAFNLNIDGIMVAKRGEYLYEEDL